MECRIFSAMMIGPRSRQEDCILDGRGVLQADLMSRESRLSADPVLLAVCDGMGGHQGGEKASRFISMELENVDFPGDISGEVLKHTLLDIQSASEHSLPSHSGTTVAGLALSGGRAIIFNAGDSRVYKITDRSIECLSHDHSLVQDLVDQRIMNEESASMHPLKHMIDFGMGPAFRHVWSVRNAHVTEHKNDPCSTYLLCTDGLTDIMSDTEIHRLLSEGSPEDGTILAEAVRKKSLADNTSFIIARIRE